MNDQNSKSFDLEDRTLAFARRCRDFLKILPQSISNREYSKQLIRSSGSIAANYIEANEALSKKDFAFRVKICRKEAKESRLWLRLCECQGENEKKRNDLIQESCELMKIFGAIIEKCKEV